MCGITGWQLKKGPDELTIYEKTVISVTLAAEMESRGRDSFGGALWFDRKQDPVIFRETGRIMLWGRDMLEQAILTDQLLVHTRAATTGAVTKQNCHPFQFGKTLGVHNGIVHNHEELNKKLKRDFQVDSQHIFAHLEEGRDVSEIQAYGAIVFTQDNENLRMSRFNGGVISAARMYRSMIDKERNEDSVGIVFASTEEPIRKATERVGLFVDFLQINDKEVYLLTGGELFTSKQHLAPAYYTKPDRTASSCALVRTMGPKTSGFTPAIPPKKHTTTLVDADGKPLNKKERKRLKRLLRGEGGEPAANTYFSSKGKLQTCYGFENVEGRDGKTYRIALCPDCNCDILLHHAGRCLAPQSLCKFSQCNTFQPCGVCGCFLVDQTHVLERIDGEPLLYCEICEQMCPVEQAKEKVSFEDFEVDDDEEPADTPPEGVALVITGGGVSASAADKTEELNLEEITDDDLADKTRLSAILRNYRETGEFTLKATDRDDS